MTKQEFDNIIEGANLLLGDDYDILFDAVNNSLMAIEILDDYAGDTHEN